MVIRPMINRPARTVTTVCCTLLFYCLVNIGKRLFLTVVALKQIPVGKRQIGVVPDGVAQRVDGALVLETFRTG